MHITPGLQRKLTRLRYHIVADRIELKLACRDPSSSARERELLALFIDARQMLLDWAHGELDALTSISGAFSLREPASTSLENALKANFNPAQPRIPAGQPGAGQWTSGGGSGNGSSTDSPFFGADGSATADDAATGSGDLSSATFGFAPDGTPIVAAGQSDGISRRPSSFPIQLEDEEGDHGAHTIRDHVGKSEDYLLRTVQDAPIIRVPNGVFYKSAEGSFTSVRAASRLVSSTLSEAENAAKVTAVAEGRILGNERIESTAPFPSPTGYEAYRASPREQPSIRPTYDVRVIIVHDPTLTRGYRVQTAFPINKKR